MSDIDKTEFTRVLKDWRAGDENARQQLAPVVYNALKLIADRQMNRERANHTLQATVLVNDAYMQLVEGELTWHDSVHFRALAATMMRRSLIDHARQRRAQKRGGGQEALTLIEGQIEDDTNTYDILELEEALTKLGEMDERKARTIELVFFGGLSYEEVAEVLSISKATVDRELRVGKAWLYNQMNPEADA
ncbi:MAG: ECF-type sigma factor [Pseudomonadota bacterium]